MTTRLYPQVFAALALLVVCPPSLAGAAEPEPEPPAPTPVPTPPAPGQPAPPMTTAQAEPPPPPANVPPADSEPPPEMTFGHRNAPASAAPVAEPVPEAPSRRTGRARTMEDVSGSTIEELTIRNVRWRYTLNYFGDISLGASKPTGAEGFFGFSLGAQDLLIRGELGNNIIAQTEMAFEPGDEGVGVDIERYHIRYQTSQFFIEAGRTHTGFGYWNNAYHHGRWLQPTIARPRWVAFEDNGGILPVHWVGAGVGARLPVGAATLNLMGTFGNGRGQIVDDVRNAHDIQSMKAFHASAELVGIGVPELRAGLAGIYSKIPPATTVVRVSNPTDSITELIAGAHVAYVNVPLLLITEGYFVDHKIGSQSWTTYGGFALVGYALGRVTPYLEVERIAKSGPSPDPFFTQMDPSVPPSQSFDTIEAIVGIRLDLSDWTALKAEYRITHDYTAGAAVQNVQQGLLNWSWGF